MRIDAGQVMLRGYEHPDEEALVRLLGDADVMHLAVTERALAPDEARRFVQDQFTANQPHRFGTLCTKDTGEVVGFGGYRSCRYLGCEDVEFGWVIAAPHQGRGHATAIGHQLIAHAFASLGLWRILGACHPMNGTSERVLRDKLGMRFRRDVEPSPGFRRRVFTLEHPRSVPQRATLRDLETAASWITSSADSVRWTGPLVPFPFDAASLATTLKFHQRQSLKLVDADGQLVAFGQFDVRLSGRGHLARLIVKPTLRGQGVGEMLVLGLIAHARGEGCARVSLNVEVGNDIAIALYERLGFADADRPVDEPPCSGARYMEVTL